MQLPDAGTQSGSNPHAEAIESITKSLAQNLCRPAQQDTRFRQNLIKLITIARQNPDLPKEPIFAEVLFCSSFNPPSPPDPKTPNDYYRYLNRLPNCDSISLAWSIQLYRKVYPNEKVVRDVADLFMEGDQVSEEKRKVFDTNQTQKLIELIVDPNSKYVYELITGTLPECFNMGEAPKEHRRDKEGVAHNVSELKKGSYTQKLMIMWEKYRYWKEHNPYERKHHPESWGEFRGFIAKYKHLDEMIDFFGPIICYYDIDAKLKPLSEMYWKPLKDWWESPGREKLELEEKLKELDRKDPFTLYMEDGDYIGAIPAYNQIVEALLKDHREAADEMEEDEEEEEDDPRDLAFMGD